MADLLTVRMFIYTNSAVIHLTDENGALVKIVDGFDQPTVEYEVRNWARETNTRLQWPEQPAFAAEKMPETDEEIDALLEPLIAIARQQRQRHIDGDLTLSVEERVWLGGLARQIITVGVQQRYLFVPDGEKALYFLKETLNGAVSVLNTRRAQLEDQQ